MVTWLMCLGNVRNLRVTPDRYLTPLNTALNMTACVTQDQHKKSASHRVAQNEDMGE